MVGLLSGSHILNKKSKVHHRSLNLYCHVIPIPKLINYSFRSSNLFVCDISVPKLVQLCYLGPTLRNHPFMSSNLFSYVIPIFELGFESHLGQNKAI